MAALAWHVEEEVRTLLGFRVIRATAVQDSVGLEAWFAPDIPVPAGPLLYGGLPELILELTLGGGEKTYTATEVDLESVPEVTPPTLGVAVTAEEFERIAATMTAAIRQAIEQAF